MESFSQTSRSVNNIRSLSEQYPKRVLRCMSSTPSQKAQRGLRRADGESDWGQEKTHSIAGKSKRIIGYMFRLEQPPKVADG